MPGEFKQLPPGGYIGRIINATETTSKNGNEMIVLDVDIAEGEYKDFFSDKYASSTSQFKTWGAKLRQCTDGASVGVFKGLKETIEACNQGFTFPFAPEPITRLNGKKIGLVFGVEEYIGNDGELRTTVRVRGVRTLDAIRKGVAIPAPKLLDEDARAKALSKKTEGKNLTPVDEDLPF
jgi:hypothetical protein